MFSKLASAIVLALPLVALAGPLQARGGGGRGGGTCNQGSPQCCNSLQQDSSGLAPEIAALVNLLLPVVGPQVGVDCTPITVIGLGGNQCTQQTACCTANGVGGSLVSVGCVAANING